MKRALLLSLLLPALLALSPMESLARETPGLGIFSGVKINPGGELDLSHNFGFLVDLPLIRTFYLTPAADTYRIGEEAATDLTLAFKFIIPLGQIRPYGAIAPGMTTFGNDRDVLLAGALGTYIQVLPNIDVLLQVEYKRFMTLTDQEAAKAGSLHGQGGILFRF